MEFLSDAYLKGFEACLSKISEQPRELKMLGEIGRNAFGFPRTPARTQTTGQKLFGTPKGPATADPYSSYEAGVAKPSGPATTKGPANVAKSDVPTPASRAESLSKLSPEMQDYIKSVRGN